MKTFSQFMNETAPDPDPIGTRSRSKWSPSEMMHPTLQKVRLSSHFDFQHDIDPNRVKSIRHKFKTQKTKAPPVLLVKNRSGSYTPLDGHHRIVAGQQRGSKTISAHVISPTHYERFVSEFGEHPRSPEDMDPYIHLPDGRYYSQVRDKD